MKSNMSSIDRLVRVIVAAIILTFYFAELITGTGGIILLALAAILAITSIIGFCPVYAMFNLSTHTETKAGQRH